MGYVLSQIPAIWILHWLRHDVLMAVEVNFPDGNTKKWNQRTRDLYSVDNLQEPRFSFYCETFMIVNSCSAFAGRPFSTHWTFVWMVYSFCFLWSKLRIKFCRRIRSTIGQKQPWTLTMNTYSFISHIEDSRIMRNTLKRTSSFHIVFTEIWRRPNTD